MARNLKFFFDNNGTPRARGPASERVLMTFLETDVQGSDHVCHDLMDDVTAIEDETAETREFIGNAHSVTITPDGVHIIGLAQGENAADPNPASDDPASHSAESSSQSTDDATAASEPAEVDGYHTGLKHFREILEDWEAFILDDQSFA